jgi:hypothetical protein
VQEKQTSGAAMGWATFAAVMLGLGGCFAILAGIAGIAEDEILVRGADYTFAFDTTTWGWIHLLLGIVLIASGLGIFSGSIAARSVGVIVAVISAVVNFMWIPYYPVWSITVIAIDLAVIWALTAHGRDLQRDLDQQA